MCEARVWSGAAWWQWKSPHLQRIAKYGPGSGKLTSLQLELLEFEPGVSGIVAVHLILVERDICAAVPIR